MIDADRYPGVEFAVGLLRVLGAVVLVLSPIPLIMIDEIGASAGLGHFVECLSGGLGCLLGAAVLSILRDIAINSFGQRDALRRLVHEANPNQPGGDSVSAPAPPVNPPLPPAGPDRPMPAASLEHVDCPNCGAKLKILADSKPNPGTTGKCPKCGARVPL